MSQKKAPRRNSSHKNTHIHTKTERETEGERSALFLSHPTTHTD